MAGRSRFERGLRELHGDDVEIIEMEPEGGEYRPTGKRYAVVRPSAKPESLSTRLLKLNLAVLGLALCVVFGLACLAGLVACGFVLWTLFGPHS